MANVKISELTAITSATDLADADVVPIVDATDTTTKKVALSVLEGFFHDSSRDFPCGITVGVDGTGADATFNAVTTGCKLLWDASAGSNAGGLCLTDNTCAVFGTGGDVNMYWDGTDLYLDAKTVGAGSLQFIGSSYAFPCGNISIGENGTGCGKDVTFRGDVGDKCMKWDANGVSNNGSLIFTDSSGLVLGTGCDAVICYDGSNLKINPQAVGSGDLGITAGGLTIANTEKLYFDGGLNTFICEDSGGTLIFNVNALVATYITDAITSVNCGLAVGLAGAGADATFNAVTSGCKMVWDASDASNVGGLCLTDATRLTFGTGGDVDMYYDGTNFTLNPRVAGTGNFLVGGVATCFIVAGASAKVGIGTGAPTCTLEVWMCCAAHCSNIILTNDCSSGHQSAIEFCNGYGSGFSAARIAGAVEDTGDG